MPSRCQEVGRGGQLPGRGAAEVGHRHAETSRPGAGATEESTHFQAFSPSPKGPSFPPQSHPSFVYKEVPFL